MEKVIPSLIGFAHKYSRIVILKQINIVRVICTRVFSSNSLLFYKNTLLNVYLGMSRPGFTKGLSLDLDLKLRLLSLIQAKSGLRLS